MSPPGCQEPGPLSDLKGTVKPYGRHVLVCCGDEPWPERIEGADTLLGRIARESKEHRAEGRWPFKATALRTEPADPAAGVDLLVFPDRIAYRGVDAPTWDRIRDDHLLEGEDGEPLDDLDPEPLSGHHVTVCVHRERDDRCGDCGPLVFEAFHEAAEAMGLDDGEVTFHRSSHVGGHRFAGNVLVYPGGTWYGYVRPGDVRNILEAHLVEGTVWEPHRRTLVNVPVD